MRGRQTQKNLNRAGSPAPLPLVPAGVLLPLWCVSLALPNLVYSGVLFADTLHIMKWVAAATPILIAVLTAGLRLAWYGRERLEVRLDAFGAIWGLMMLYCAAQPLWTAISSPTGWLLEFCCLATVWAFYVLSVNAFPEGGLRPILWLASLNGAINVLFAELQERHLYDLAFLKGTFLEFLTPLRSLIMPTSVYIGNTAQMNMMALWLALCVLSLVYLLISGRPRGHGRFPWRVIPNLCLMGVNLLGLMKCVSRSGLLALFVGLLALGIAGMAYFGRAYARRMGLIFLIFLAAYGGLMLSNEQRREWILEKVTNMVENAWAVGDRIGIWTTSATMFREHPMGVGIGQYKWHYLKAQREGFRRLGNPDWYPWQYTHWAHNEFLQWFCEGGIPGGTMLLLMYGLWLFAAVRGLWRVRQGAAPALSALWGCGMVALFTFDALWTRPFHRIENILWLALAFALTNREFLTGRLSWRIRPSDGLLRLAGAACVLASLAGAVYLGGGVQGNLLLRRALNTQRQHLQRSLLEEAGRHSIVREEVQRNLGYHYLQVGDQTHNLETMREGFKILWEHFLREPHSEDLNKLLSWSQRFQLRGIILELVSYLKPGTFHLVRRQAADSSGKPVSALMVMSGPGPLAPVSVSVSQ